MLKKPKAQLCKIPLTKFTCLTAAINKLDDTIWRARYDAGHPPTIGLTYLVSGQSMDAYMRIIRDAKKDKR